MRMFYEWREVEKTYKMTGKKKKELKCLAKRERTDKDIGAKWLEAFRQAQMDSRGE